MEKRKIGHTTFSQSFHRGYCTLCEKTAKIVASNTDRNACVKKIIEHMDSAHGVRAAEFLGTVYENRIGRPTVGDTVLDKITVPSELKSALEAKAEELGLSVPDVRREAYRKFTE